ncbi:hypothetical protein BASA61_000876 [Batrachochytrium salamandrivorans]|nr:hypothetical protein BASA61_000876 [Batrachochytrium salamandrivorans]
MAKGNKDMKGALSRNKQHAKKPTLKAQKDIRSGHVKKHAKPLQSSNKTVISKYTVIEQSDSDMDQDVEDNAGEDYDNDMDAEDDQEDPDLAEDDIESSVDDEDMASEAEKELTLDDEIDGDSNAHDSFFGHFDDSISESLVSLYTAVDANDWVQDADEHPLLQRVMTSTLADRPTVTIPQGDAAEPSMLELKVKNRVLSQWDKLNGKIARKTGGTAFTPLQKALFPFMNSYADVLYSNQTHKFDRDIRNLIALHSLNHVHKTRDYVMKHTAKLKAELATNKPQSEYRDQGFTRPTVLILAPFRHSAFQIIETLIALSGSTSQDNKKRFMDEFATAPGEDGVDIRKPEDFRKIFAGNIDDCFRIGIRFSKKQVKLFAPFYSSDIIVASPLGLKMIIGSEGDKKRDFDFLASIEIVILDQAEIFLMQNWDHVKSVFDHLNLIPKDAHGCDFSRVRSYALDGRAKYVRQNIVFSRFTTPEINALATSSCNIGGRIRITRPHSGTISEIVSHAPQLFHRIPQHSVQSSPDTRFSYFIEQILPTLRRSVVQQTHTLIFIPSYFDFVRVRNYLTDHKYNFGAISEYTPRSDADRLRRQFSDTEISFLICTERYHFFRRHNLKGIRHIVFYQMPVNAGFYPELLNMLESNAGDLTSSAIYSAFDKLALERVVGSVRVDRMIKGAKDTFMFMS